MLRLCSVGFLFTILLAGGVNSNVQNLVLYEGDSFPIFANTRLGHTVETCLLETPQNGIFEFEPRNASRTTEKYEILNNSNADCFVQINNVDLKDEGVWTMTYAHDDDDTDLAPDARSVNITVNIIETTTEPEVNEEKIYGKVLSMIRHATRIGMLIDISLDKKSFDEECYVRAPNGVLTKAEDFMMENVTVQSSSNFVSCRITLGPMSESLLGTWKLCGKSKVNEEMRCQPAEVVWNSAQWNLITQNMFNHPVHYGGSVLSGVSHVGTVETCTVITPNGENLVITNDVTYPNIERIAVNNVNLCTINFTNIDQSSIGDWAINGKFRSSFTGFHEIHLPLRFFLYNEEQPYDQAYNVTTLPEDRYLVILGRTLEVSVNSIGDIENCQYRTPSGQFYDLDNVIGPDGVDLKGVDATPACRITLSPITEDMIGEWTLIGKFSNRNQFNERRQTFHVIQEDPANPIIDEFREVEELSEWIFDSELEASHRITIADAQPRVEHESCHLLTPDGLQYAFIDGFHVPNVEILEETGVECGVRVNVTSLDMLGQYTLIARATRRASAVTYIERRRPFTIRIEEHSSLGNAITVAEGADLYLSLPEATDMYDTCKLYGPDGEEVTDFQVDQFRYRSCGFIVKNVTHAQRGTWTIVYGTQIIYKASVKVNILELVEISINDMVWTAGSSVNMTIGPEDAVYCRLLDNNFKSIFEGFGPCKIELDSVTMAHKGRWRISVGLPGTVMLREKSFDVNVLPADNRPIVSTHVTMNGSSVVLTCSVPAENEVQACLFRDPTGTVLIASHGVGQDGFSGAVIRYESDSESHNCSLRLLTPSSRHQGMWRCAVNTEQHTSYAFLGITTSMINQTMNYDTIEPVFRSSSHSYRGADGDAVTMSCYIDAAIRYCYYRAPNGTVFNVGPSISSEDYNYIGNGFDAGECGVRFNNLWRNDSGDWSCNVGVVGNQEEFSRSFDVTVYKRMSIWHGLEGDNSVSLRFSLGDKPELEYCRFVRIDGLGFTSDNVPVNYYLSTVEMSYGSCSLNIPTPSSVDLQPWTVFAKAYGKDGELSMTSSFTSPTQYLSEKPCFTSDNVPVNYYLSTVEMSYGSCSLNIPTPSSVDLQPWTVFAKAYGKDGELSMTSSFTSPTQYLSEKPCFTSDNVPVNYYLSTVEMSYVSCSLNISTPSSVDLQPWTVFAKAYGKDGELSMTSSFTSPTQYLSEKPLLMGILLWTFFGILCLLLLLVAVSLIPKKNRQWTYERAAIIRNSFRKSPPPTTTTHTAMLY